MSDQIAIIRDGRIVQSGPPRRALRAAARPASSPTSSARATSSAAAWSRSTATGSSTRWRDAATCRRARERRGRSATRSSSPSARRRWRSGRARGPRTARNGIAGEISAWNYHGTSFHVLVRTAALGELIVTSPAWRSEVEPEVGRRVHLVWSADAAGVVAPD